MAGIGFELNKLARRDDLMGIAAAYIHSAFAIAGPWLFTVVALAVTTYLYGGNGSVELLNFRSVIVYNFSATLAISAPTYMIITRYLADHIHIKDVTSVPTIMLESMMLVNLCCLPLGIFWYGYYFEMDTALRLAAFANLFLIATVWVLAVYLTALKDFAAVTRAFTIGMVIAVVVVDLFAEGDAAKMVAGYCLGLTVIIFLLTGRIFAEYPYRLTHEFGLKPFWKKYWELAVGGFFYNAALWIDKWIMWYAPESAVLETKMRFYPDYDSAMFMAAMTILPALALFVFSVEMNFFTHYRRFYGNILAHASMRRIRHFHEKINESILEGARNLTVLQGMVTFLAILLAPKIFDWLGMFYIQLAIFRLGALGTFFQALLLFSSIILQYFDCRRENMWIFIVYFATNAIFTLVTIQMGFEYYGFGFFLASLVTFLMAATILFNHVRKLPYHAFITHNNSVTVAKVKTSADYFDDVNQFKKQFRLGVIRGGDARTENN
jgi:uncharacterized membrane protein